MRWNSLQTRRPGKVESHTAMGFIGYQRDGDRVRIFLECSDQPDGTVEYSYAVDVAFRPAARLEGVNDILALKKFYKLVNSLEERAREHGRDRTGVFATPESLLAHLAWTRNARQFPPSALLRCRRHGGADGQADLL